MIVLQTMITFKQALCLLVLACCAAAAAPAQQSYYPPPQGAPPAAIELQEGSIVGSTDGLPVTLKLAAWGNAHSQPFSSFIAVTQPEAAGDSTLSHVLVTAAFQLHKGGFNTIALPFSFDDLLAPAPAQNTHLCQQLPVPSPITQTAAIRQNEGLDISRSGSMAGVLDRIQQATDNNSSSSSQTGPQVPVCLSLLPNSTTLDRYLWSVQWFLSNGFYVIMSSDSSGTLSNRAATSCLVDNSRSTGCQQGAAALADAWKQVWAAVLALPGFGANAQGRLLLQLLDGVRATEQRWEAYNSSKGQRREGLHQVYLGIMDDLDSISPGAALFILQGPQQQVAVGAGLDQWGNGFTANPVLVSQGCSDPTPMFKALINKPYRNKVILAPHISAPQASNSSSASAKGGTGATAVDQLTDEAHPEGPGVSKVLDNTFHHLSQQGFCVTEDNCVKFPVLVVQQTRDESVQEQLKEFSDSDFTMFADYMLLQQSITEGSTGYGIPTGSWYHWETLSDNASSTADTAGKPQK